MTTSEPIPYFDLTRQYAHYQADWFKEIEHLGRTGNFILGNAVAELETKLADYLGVKHAITVANGTDALVIALRALGIGRGDAVIVPDFTFYASVEAVSLVGAEPRFVDIELDDFNISSGKIQAAIDERVKAIMPVHLFGLPANINEICTIGEQHSIPVIEDAAQAFGSLINGKYSGAVGTIGCFSFYPTKIIGAYGDGGMITTDRDDLAATIKLLRNHGTTGPNRHDLIGCNSRLDAVQAVLLGLKLKSVNEMIERRRQLAARYFQNLTDCDIVLPTVPTRRSHVYNIFTIRSSHRDRITSALIANRIGHQIYYPMPIHKQAAYQHLGLTDAEYPASVQASREVVSLPLYPNMPDSHVDRVCEVIRGALD